MPTHNNDGEGNGLKPRLWQEPEEHGPEKVDFGEGFEATDVGAKGIVVFLTSLAILVVVTAFLCYGIGKAFNAVLDKEDGPNTKWAQSADKSVRQLGNLANNPEIQNRVSELTKTFPTPRLQLDDGNEDVAELHARESLLLENYSWVDRSKGKVRIPIERAMELIAQRGLPVAPAAQRAPAMTGDAEPGVTEPLTDGFAPTAYELEQARLRAAEARHPQ